MSLFKSEAKLKVTYYFVQLYLMFHLFVSYVHRLRLVSFGKVIYRSAFSVYLYRVCVGCGVSGSVQGRR